MGNHSECFEEILSVVVRRMLPGGDLRELYELDRDGGDVDEIWGYASEEGISREVFEAAVQRVANMATAPPEQHVAGERCWECTGCGWQLLDPELELKTAVCLCGTGAGSWKVGMVRPRHDTPGLPIAGEIRPLGREDLERVTRQLYPRAVAVLS